MGYGDELMVAGEARRRGGDTGKRFAVPDPRGAPRPPFRWSDVWEGNARMARPGEPFDATIENYPGCRPYIADKTRNKWTWRPYVPMPAEYYIINEREEALREQARGLVVVNSQLKPGASPNKHWGYGRWQDLVDSRPQIPWVQIGLFPELRGVRHILTRSFREGAAVVAGARAVITHEGGLHHVAAALSVPAVVIFGGYISPIVTGYAAQANLYVPHEAHPLGCGFRIPCIHCQKAMAGIRRAHVLAHLEKAI